MRHALEIQPTSLPAGTLHRMQDVKGQQVTALSGVVWMTQAHDPRDIVLTKGQSAIVERNGTTVLYALKDAAVTIGEPGHIAAVRMDGIELKGEAA